MTYQERKEYFKSYFKNVKPLWVRSPLAKQVKEEKERSGAKDTNEFIALLLLNWKQNPIIIPSEKTIFSTLAPALITGIPGSGKTTAIKEILKTMKGPMLVIDPENEYNFLKKITESEVYQIDWSKKQQIRYVPTLGVNPRPTTRLILEKAITEKEKLKEWIFIIDEGQKFTGMKVLREFLAEGRKWTRKIIFITSDWKEFEGLGMIIRVPERIVIISPVLAGSR